MATPLMSLANLKLGAYLNAVHVVCRVRHHEVAGGDQLVMVFVESVADADVALKPVSASKLLGDNLTVPSRKTEYRAQHDPKLVHLSRVHPFS